MNSSRGLFAVSTVLAVLLVAAGGWAAVRDRYLIVPGRAAGPAVLGMPGQELVRQLGRPSGEVRAQAQARLSWPGLGLTVRLDGDGKVDAVFVESPRFRTAEGVGVGSTRQEVLAAFGATDRAQEDRSTLILAYPALGISFAIRKDRDRVELVMVYRPG
jgi:hypothetical protein